MFLSGGRDPGHDRPAAAPHPALAQLRAYWEALRRAGVLPARAEIDPRGIDRALEHAFIAERLAPGVARFRLAGMYLNELMGMEVRGMPLACFFDPDARAPAGREIERAFTGRAAVELLLESPRGLGRPALAARMLLLPLRNEAGQVARLLGGLAADGVPGRAPRRFLLTGALSGRPAQVAETLPGNPAAPLLQRGHLRLVHSRDS